VSKYRLILAEKANFEVTMMCRLLEVARSAYYAWVGRPASARAVRADALAARIVALHEDSDGTYGAPRILADLRAEGEVVSAKTVAKSMRASLVTDALAMAIVQRGHPIAGVIFHSDRGVQYTSAAMRRLADAYGVRLSVGRTGVCWDNAMAESFFATFKNELIYRHPWPTLARTKTAIITWIEGRYNRRRRHSAIDMLTPVQFETAARHAADQAA